MACIDTGFSKTTMLDTTSCHINPVGVNSRALDAYSMALVEHALASGGWRAGWKTLWNITGRDPTLEKLYDEAMTCVEVYSKVDIRINSDSRPWTTRMKIVRECASLSLNEIGPKGKGGSAWKENATYQCIQCEWNSEGYELLSPCVAFIWLGLQKKIVHRDDSDICAKMQLLSTVDYDYDLSPESKDGFSSALRVAGNLFVADTSDAMGRAASAALISMDLQAQVRDVQNSWLLHEKKQRVYMTGGNISPGDWYDATVADCAGLCPFGYEGTERHETSRPGMFIAMVLANSYDVVYDIGCSNRMSSITYAYEKSRVMVDKLLTLVDTEMEAIADRVCHSESDIVPLYGDSAALVTGAWAPFNCRYRSWERYVKYIRQQRSTIMHVENIDECLGRDNAVDSTVSNCDSLKNRWIKMIDTGVETVNKHRSEITSVSWPMMTPWTENIPLPLLCTQCAPQLNAVVFCGEREVLLIPPAVGMCKDSSAVFRAAGLRDMAMWAAGSGACDLCAVRVSQWIDEASHIVLVDLMKSEPRLNSQHWLAECYGVWAVAKSIKISSTLVGFELDAELLHEEGAMGIRDVEDC
ncbi:hypothetical protein K7432_014509 [Basidiobolus ranarum]|uniref:Uncharacterized protein n=1 Tax=Basidiobolus ranarum TaxID=34480 RepID=A0ABR2VQA8_9FUNG